MQVEMEVVEVEFAPVLLQEFAMELAAVACVDAHVSCTVHSGGGCGAFGGINNC